MRDSGNAGLMPRLVKGSIADRLGTPGPEGQQGLLRQRDKGHKRERETVRAAVSLAVSLVAVAVGD